MPHLLGVLLAPFAVVFKTLKCIIQMLKPPLTQPPQQPPEQPPQHPPKLPPKLPPEILTLIFASPNLSPQDVLSCFNVCKLWYLIAKNVYYKNITITTDSNVPLFVQSLEEYGFGPLVTGLSVSYKSKNARRPPFTIPAHSSLLLLNCQNIRTIHLTRMNPYYILLSLGRTALPHLEAIEVCWETCSSSNSVKKKFYAANYNHRSSIEYIKMPGSPTVVLFFTFQNRTIHISDVEFFEAFVKLKSHEYHDWR